MLTRPRLGVLLVIASLLLGGLALAESGPSGAELSRLDPRRDQTTRDAALDRGREIGRAMTAAKGGAALAALGLVAWGAWLDRRGRGGSLRTTRRAALLGLAILAFAAHYNFFQWRHYGGIHAHEFFHYYLGARYFPEVGYYDLYSCVVGAVSELEPGRAAEPVRIRDLRRIDQQLTIIPERAAARCRAEFSPQRWQAFRRDAVFMKSRFPPAEWARLLSDQGLNASPVWLIFGRTLGEWVPAEPRALALYARADLILLAAGFGATFWAFGLEGLALALLAFAANPLSRYEWIGDTPLRQIWFSTMLIGIACLRRHRPTLAGLFLATSALARVFPIFYAVSYGARHARQLIVERRLDPGFVRFAVAGTLGGLALIALAAPISGRGGAVIGEFVSNISSYSSMTASNSMGAPALASYTTEPTTPRLVGGELVVVEADRKAQQRRTFAARRSVYWAGVGIGLVLLWRALAAARDWEAAALGFVLILLFTQAAGYYMTCTASAALLGTRRVRIALALLATLVAWSAIGVIEQESPFGFMLSSWVALAFALATLLFMRADPDPPAPAIAPGRTPTT